MTAARIAISPDNQIDKPSSLISPAALTEDTTLILIIFAISLKPLTPLRLER